MLGVVLTFLLHYGAPLHFPLSLCLVREGPKYQATGTLGMNETTRVVAASPVASRKAAPMAHRGGKRDQIF